MTGSSGYGNEAVLWPLRGRAVDSPLGLSEALVVCARQGRCQGASTEACYGDRATPVASAQLITGLPSPSAPSTAIPPTARSPTCCARPWESPPPRWTAPSGLAPAGTLAVLLGWGVAQLSLQVQASWPRSQACWADPKPGVPLCWLMGVSRGPRESSVLLPHPP